jgi:hypothetical protein
VVDAVHGETLSNNSCNDSCYYFIRLRGFLQALATD